MTTRSFIRIMCPNLNCQRVLAVPNSARGQVVRCGACGVNVRIPMPKTQQKPPPPPASADDEQQSERPPAA